MSRPYIHVNVAMTADGKIDTVERAGAAISSAADRERVDALRAEADAVLVGGRTLLAEDPRLTVKSADLSLRRLAEGRPENPAKVGIVSVAGLDPAGRFMTAGPARRIVCTTSRTPPEQVARLEEAGAEVWVLGAGRVDLPAALAAVYRAGLHAVLVEGGGTLISGLFALGVVDELTLYLAPVIFGGAAAPTLADGPGFALEDAPRLELVSVEPIDPEGGILIRYRAAPRT